MPPSAPRPSQEHRDPRDYYANQLAVFYRDKGALQALLEGTEAVTQARAFQILGKDGTGGDTGLPYSLSGSPVQLTEGSRDAGWAGQGRAGGGQCQGAEGGDDAVPGAD